MLLLYDRDTLKVLKEEILNIIIPYRKEEF